MGIIVIILSGESPRFIKTCSIILINFILLPLLFSYFFSIITDYLNFECHSFYNFLHDRDRYCIIFSVIFIVNGVIECAMKIHDKIILFIYKVLFVTKFIDLLNLMGIFIYRKFTPVARLQKFPNRIDFLDIFRLCTCAFFYNDIWLWMSSLMFFFCIFCRCCTSVTVTYQWPLSFGPGPYHRLTLPCSTGDCRPWKVGMAVGTAITKREYNVRYFRLFIIFLVKYPFFGYVWFKIL